MVDLSLNYHGVGSPSPGKIDGLYVFTSSTDVVSMTWNNDNTVITGVYNPILGAFELPAVSQPNDGIFTLTINGISKIYGYTNNEDDLSFLGASSTIIECDSGHVWFNDDNNAIGSVWGSDTSTIQIGGSTIYTPIKYLDGVSPIKGRQVLYDFGTGYSSGQVLNFDLTIYTNGTPSFSLNYNFTIPVSLPCPTCLSGNNAPQFNNVSFTNTCPSLTFNLGSLVPNNQIFTGNLEFHNSSSPSGSSLLSNLNVGAGTYYAVYHSTTPVDCYSPTQAITVVINPCQTANATNHSYTSNANLSISGNVSSNNTLCNAQTTSYQISGNLSNVLPHNTTHGIITSFNQSTGSYTWIPNLNTVGNFTNEFSYDLLCDNVIIDTAYESFTVNPVANANDDTNTVKSGQTISGDLKLNDVACTGNSVTTYQIGTLPTQGTATFNSNGTYNYTAPSGFVGTVTFTYNILCDGVVKDTATVTIVVQPANCSKTINLKYLCYQPKLVTGVKILGSNNNIVTGWTNTGITFTTDPGMHDYKFTVVDTDDVTHFVTVKNILCN